MEKISYEEYLKEVNKMLSDNTSNISKIEAELNHLKTEHENLLKMQAITNKDYETYDIGKHVWSKDQWWKIKYLMSENYIQWGSAKWWSMMPNDVNAVTYEPIGQKVMFFKEHYGHYHNYTDDYRGGPVIPKGQRGKIKQKWYWSSIFEPLHVCSLVDLNINSHPFIAPKRTDTSIIICYRESLGRKQFDLNNIDWSLVPNWANMILIASESKRMEIEFADDGYIDDYNNIRTHYILPDHTRPDGTAKGIYDDENYNYEFINIPNKNTIIKRP